MNEYTACFFNIPKPKTLPSHYQLTGSPVPSVFRKHVSHVRMFGVIIELNQGSLALGGTGERFGTFSPRMVPPSGNAFLLPRSLALCPYCGCHHLRLCFLHSEVDGSVHFWGLIHLCVSPEGPPYVPP